MELRYEEFLNSPAAADMAREMKKGAKKGGINKKTELYVALALYILFI